jgi:Chitobiase/beta-hexosaminidase C-terminal domain
MSDATAGATIYYTTDGANPTTASSVYPLSTGRRKSRGIVITGKGHQAVKAMATALGYSNSAIAEADFTVN